VDVQGALVGNGGTSSVTATLAPGTYTFYCAVAGHEAGGMTGTLVVTDAAVAGPPTPAPPPAPLDGPGLFRQNCAGCHTMRAAGSTGTVGPDLDDRSPDADKVVRQVNRGEDPMPSFRDTLTPGQITLIATFVARATDR
jgi:mono/diheme cytochrome c family protein